MSETLKLLSGSESLNMPTGYGIVMNNLLERLLKNFNWEVHHIGWQHQGMPTKFYVHQKNTITKNGKEITIDVPTSQCIYEYEHGLTDMMARSFPEMLPRYFSNIKPDVYFSLIDFWFTDGMVQMTNKYNVPYVNYFPVDGAPFYAPWLEYLKQTSYPTAMSNYGKEVVKSSVRMWGRGGWTRHFDMDVLYHGIDKEIFKPFNKDRHDENRKKIFKNNPDMFVIGSVGKNCQRKQHTRLLQAFAEFAKGKDDVVLALKVGDPIDRSKQGYHLPMFAQSLGLKQNQILWLDRAANLGSGIPTEELAMIYDLMDVHALATSGEGFGIPTIEAAACGTPNVITNYTTSEELVNDAGWLVPCSDYLVGEWQVKHGLVDIHAMAQAFEEAYNKPKLVKKLGNEAHRFAHKNFGWDAIAKKADEILRHAVDDFTVKGDKK